MNNAETEIRKKIKKWPFVAGGVLILLLVLMVTVLSGPPAAAAQGAGEAVAEKGYIRTTVVGTGNLENDDAEDLELYSALEYDAVLVEAGDTVRQGDVLARVNAATVNDRMKAVQQEMETLDGQIYAAGSGFTDKYVYSKVEGRVKAVYAAKNTAVQNTMQSSGAVALISLDGKMAVDFDSADELWIGRYVQAVLPDGTVRDAKITKAEKGSFTAAFDDRDVTVDMAVTVRYDDGTVIAEGGAYIPNPLYVTETDGVVREIYIAVDDYVYNGTSLFYVDTIHADSEYRSLQKDREELLEELNDLLKLQESGDIIAEFDGEIASVNIREKDSAAGGMAAQQTGTEAQTAGYGTAETPDSTAATTAGASQENKSIALAYYPLGTVRLRIHIDELDILKVQPGQEATVVFDAMEGEEFTGTITSLDQTGTVTGGTAKYGAIIELAKTENMRAGMSATATITIEENGSALLLPVAALQEYGERIFVYGSYNSDSSAFGDERDVETGLSDGEKVEILSGLSEGDRVYYAAAQSDDPFMTFGGGMRGSGGAADGE